MLFCPSCSSPLVAVEFQKVELDYCPLCRGCWFDHRELALLLHGDPGAEVRLETGARVGGRRPCPRCGDHMDTAPVTDTAVTLDLCRHEHGWWLDAGELRSLINAAARHPELAALSHFCDSVIGAVQT
jgi:Zn-finger nucleic acid-binding protein